MKTITIIAAAIIAASPALAAETVTVKPHITKQGVYKPPSYRTAPNNTKFDNFSTKGNYNPYSGKIGTIDPYKMPTTQKKRSNF